MLDIIFLLKYNGIYWRKKCCYMYGVFSEPFSKLYIFGCEIQTVMVVNDMMLNFLNFCTPYSCTLCCVLKGLQLCDHYLLTDKTCLDTG